jgi:hypothetical protein
MAAHVQGSREEAAGKLHGLGGIAGRVCGNHGATTDHLGMLPTRSNLSSVLEPSIYSPSSLDHTARGTWACVSPACATYSRTHQGLTCGHAVHISRPTLTNFSAVLEDDLFEERTAVLVHTARTVRAVWISISPLAPVFHLVKHDYWTFQVVRAMAGGKTAHFSSK